MKQILTRYELTDWEVNDHPIWDDFYSFIATALGHDPDCRNIRYDCTKINVSPLIQHTWYTKFEECKLGDPVSLTMLLCISGPKVDITLQGYTVEVLDGCINYENPSTVTDHKLAPAILEHVNSILNEGIAQLYGLAQSIGEDPEFNESVLVSYDGVEKVEEDAIAELDSVVINKDTSTINFSLKWRNPEDYDTVIKERQYSIQIKELS